jgi:hypothetical protein
MFLRSGPTGGFDLTQTKRLSPARLTHPLTKRFGANAPLAGGVINPRAHLSKQPKRSLSLTIAAHSQQLTACLAPSPCDRAPQTIGASAPKKVTVAVRSTATGLQSPTCANTERPCLLLPHLTRDGREPRPSPQPYSLLRLPQRRRYGLHDIKSRCESSCLAIKSL